MALRSCIAALAVAGFGGAAAAATFDFDGHIAYHTDVVQIPFTLLADAVDVKVWTDSYMDGVNFDPITAVWSLPSGVQVAFNDDNGLIAPGQTGSDSGLVFPALAAGNYLFTIGAYDNFPNGAQLSDGFRNDGQTPVPMSSWCQPPTTECIIRQGYWRVHLSGVDAATPPVPEPAAWALLAAGIAVLARTARRRR